MSRILGRLRGAAAAHPWRTIGGWLIALMALSTLSLGFGAASPATQSQAGVEFLRTHLPHLSGADARVVVHDSKRLDFGAVEELRSRLSDLPGATVVTPPRMSVDGDTALITVQYDSPVTDLHSAEGIDALRAAAQPLISEGIQVEFGGQVAENIATAQAYDLVAAAFGPGANGPLVIVVDLTKGVDPDELVVRLRGEPGVARVPVAYIDGVAAVIRVEPTTGPQDERTTELLRHLRASVLPDGVLVTGPVAMSADSSDRLAPRLWIVVAVVVAPSLLLFTVLVGPAMRSPSRRTRASQR